MRPWLVVVLLLLGLAGAVALGTWVPPRPSPPYPRTSGPPEATVPLPGELAEPVRRSYT